MKSYTKVKNRGFNLDKFRSRGFVVQEKLDGSNASFTYNNGELEVFSRRTKLDEGNTLNGFYGWVHENINKELSNFLENYIIFGEWLVKHKVEYKDEFYKDFYVFDIFDKKREVYLRPQNVMNIAEEFNLNHVDCLMIVYPSNYLKELDVQEILELAGKSNMTVRPNSGEGIVIKYLDGKQEGEEYYKIVTKEFKETMRQKHVKPKVDHSSIADFAITEARLNKMIYRAIDEQRLSEEDLHLECFGKVMKEVSNDFVADILEEELDTMVKVIEKQIKKKIPNLLRPILEEKAEKSLV